MIVDKVTALITRSCPTDASRLEVLVFRHANPAAGIQLPAGTVEPGEALEPAVLREAAEETGLTELEIVGEPVRAPLELADDQVYLAEHARIGGLGSPVARVLGEHGDDLRLEALAPDGSARELSVPRDSVTRDVRRFLFHLRVTAHVPDRWQRAHDTPRPWHFYWVDLESDPGLRPRHAEWFARMRPRLRGG